MNKERVIRLLVVLPACLLLYGAEGCPLFPDPAEQTPGTADGGLTAMDLGGENGAYWTVTHAGDVLVTVRAGGRTASARTSPGGASLSLLYSSVHLASFCTRSDTICPGTVLPAVTAIIQPRDSGNQCYVGFNRMGPLAFLGSQVGLIGLLSGSSLSIPLGTFSLPQAKGNLCALQNGSKISATATGTGISNRADAGTDAGTGNGADAGTDAGTGNGAGSKADTLTGTVTLVYAWKCFNIGGSSQVQKDALVELSTTFTARRK